MRFVAANSYNLQDSLTLSTLALEAIQDSSAWQKFVEEFNRAFRGTANFLILLNNNGNAPIGRLSFSYGLSLQDLHEWQTIWFAEDPWMKNTDLNQQPVGEVVTTEQLCPEETLIQTRIYKGFMAPRNIHHGGGVNYLLGEDTSAIHTMVRPKEVGPLTTDEIELWKSIIPVVQAVVRASVEIQRVRHENRALEASFEAWGTGLVFLNANGMVVRCNGAGEELIARSAHATLREKALVLKDKALQKQLLLALEEFARPIGFYVSDSPWRKMIVCRDIARSENSMLILLTRLAQENVSLLGPETPVALAYIIDPNRPVAANPEILRDLFSLTPAEVRFSTLLVGGQSVSEACAELQITPNTGRTHLKRIFSKTGVQRQAELIALLLSLSMRSTAPVSPAANILPLRGNGTK